MKVKKKKKDVEFEDKSSESSDHSDDSDSALAARKVNFSDEQQVSFLHWRFHNFCRDDLTDYMDQRKCLEWIRTVNKSLPAKERQLNCRKILKTYGDGPEKNRILHASGFVKYYLKLKTVNKDRFFTEMERLGMTESLLCYNGQYIADLSSPIGRGAFGMVYFGLSTDAARCGPNKRVAIKVIEMNWHHAALTKRVVRELVILRQIKDNANVITLMDVKPGERENVRRYNYIHMFSNFMTVDLERHLKNPEMFYSMDDVRSIMKQMLQGIQYLHACQVVHRDLKPSNILLTRLENGEYDCRICDFGLARSLDENRSRPHLLFDDSSAPSTGPSHRPSRRGKMRLTNDVSSHVVTRYWRAPEVSFKIQDRSILPAIDVWAIGCIFAEVLQMVKTIKFYKLGDYVENGHYIAQIAERNGRIQVGMHDGLPTHGGMDVKWKDRDDVKANPQRRELFKGGADTMLSGSEIHGTSEDDQLTCIAINLGRPPEKFLRAAHKNLRDRLKKLSTKPKLKLEHSLTAPPDAMKLLKQMLTWDPAHRIEAGTALLEPFFMCGLDLMQTMKSHDLISANLLDTPIKDPEFVRSMSTFEDIPLENSMWKKLVTQEIYHHNPDLAKPTSSETRE